MTCGFRSWMSLTGPIPTEHQINSYLSLKYIIYIWGIQIRVFSCSVHAVGGPAFAWEQKPIHLNGLLYLREMQGKFSDIFFKTQLHRTAWFYGTMWFHAPEKVPLFPIHGGAIENEWHHRVSAKEQYVLSLWLGEWVRFTCFQTRYSVNLNPCQVNCLLMLLNLSWASRHQ